MIVNAWSSLEEGMVYVFFPNLGSWLWLQSAVGTLNLKRIEFDSYFEPFSRSLTPSLSAWLHFGAACICEALNAFRLTGF